MTLTRNRGMIKVIATPMTPYNADRSNIPVDLIAPQFDPSPIVFASPHSGREYTDAFLDQSPLTPLELRSSEDAFVDELFDQAPSFGATLLAARFPRAFVDVNREAWELDPNMFRGELPNWAKTRTPRVAAGLGMVPKIVADGAEIYRNPLPAKEAHDRVRQFHEPYHRTLSSVLEDLHDWFGKAVLIDCHSMPSRAGGDDSDTPIDVVLGDRYGRSCDPVLISRAERSLREQGLSVARNTPYAGGYSTERYGRPHEGRHALQIEFNRRLYLDEQRIERSSGFAAFKNITTQFARELTDFVRTWDR